MSFKKGFVNFNKWLNKRYVLSTLFWIVMFWFFIMPASLFFMLACDFNWFNNLVFKLNTRHEITTQEARAIYYENEELILKSEGKYVKISGYDIRFTDNSYGSYIIKDIEFEKQFNFFPFHPYFSDEKLLYVTNFQIDGMWVRKDDGSRALSGLVKEWVMLKKIYNKANYIVWKNPVKP